MLIFFIPDRLHMVLYQHVRVLVVSLHPYRIRFTRLLSIYLIL